MPDPEVWSILDRLMQWLILPAIAFIWAMNVRVSTHDREILRILTILEERNARHEGEKVEWAKVVTRLEAAVEKLSNKIDAISHLRE